MFGALFDSIKSGVAKQLPKDQNFLEGCAACAAYVSMEGGIEEAELQAAINAAMHNDMLTGSFSVTQIEGVFIKMFKKAESGTVTAKRELMREIRESAEKFPDNKMEMVAVGVDAVAHDGLKPEEETLLKYICEAIRVDYNRMMMG